MPRRSRLIPALAIASCFAQELAGPRILRPEHQSVVEPGPISVIAWAPGTTELRLDGKPLAATRAAPGVLTATFTAAPGIHELALASSAGEQKLRFFAGPLASAPEGWNPYKPHPPAVSCETCHVASSGKWALKGDTAGESCFGCHDPEPFPKLHTHNSETLAECQLCHDPHGSKAKSLLTMPRQTACKQCHG